MALANTILIVVGLIVIIIGVLAGIYPAFVLSSFKTIHVLKGELRSGLNISQVLRKSLVVVQQAPH